MQGPARPIVAIGVLVPAILLAGCSATPVPQATSLAPTPTPAASPGESREPAPSTADTAGPSAATPPAAPAPDAVPPKPGDPTFTLVSETPNQCTY